MGRLCEPAASLRIPAWGRLPSGAIAFRPTGSSLALGVPELEQACGGCEVGRQLGCEEVNFLAELERLVVKPAFSLAAMTVVLVVLERGAAVGARHVAGAEHGMGQLNSGRRTGFAQRAGPVRVLALRLVRHGRRLAATGRARRSSL